MSVSIAGAVGTKDARADELTGPVTPTTMSGIGGHNNVLSKPESIQASLVGVRISEKSDEPCFLEARYRDVQTSERLTPLSFTKCSDKSSKREGNASTHRIVELPPETHTIGVRICLNNKRERLKGIQLIGSYESCVQGERVTLVPQDCSRVFKQGSMEYRLCNTGQTPAYKEVACSSSAARVERHYERNNCPGTKRGPDSDWEREVFCPSGMVATGMRLGTRAGGGDRRLIDGVGLECRTLGERRGASIVRSDS